MIGTYDGTLMVSFTGHHPDLHLVGWNNVKLDVWTHSVGMSTSDDN